MHPCELWQDIDVADMLDAVASFQQDDDTMTALRLPAAGLIVVPMTTFFTLLSATIAPLDSPSPP